MDLLCTIGGGAAVKNSVVVPLKTKHRISTQSSNSTFETIPKKIENRGSNRYLYTCVHISSLHNTQKVKIAQMSINR